MLIAMSRDVQTTAGNLALMETIFGYALFAIVGWIWDRAAQLVAWFTRSEPEPVRIEPVFDATLTKPLEDRVTHLRGFGLTKRGSDFR